MAGKTVDKYIGMLKSVFIFYSVSRYDIKGKQFLKTLGKNYIIDLGFSNMLLGYRDVDRSHILKNVVFLELLRRDYRVSIGKKEKQKTNRHFIGMAVFLYKKSN